MYVIACWPDHFHIIFKKYRIICKYASYCFHWIQQEAIAKAVNNVESAVKEKHIRNILLHIYDSFIKRAQEQEFD